MPVTTRLETVTPKMAAEWLEKYNTRNRNMRDLWARTLARVITEGRWIVTHQGIAFNGDNTLIDGQHRLRAIVIANKPVQVYVTRGLPSEARAYIDTNKARTDLDRLGPAGIGLDITKVEIAIAKAMMAGPSYFQNGFTTACTTEELRRFIVANMDAIKFVTGGLKVEGSPSSAIGAVLARAWYSRDRDRLARFMTVMIDGIVEDAARDRAAILLRDQYLAKRGRMSNRDRVELYKKTETALRAFLAGTPLVSLRCTDRELFPIPHDAEK